MTVRVRNQIDRLGSVSLGAKFVFRTAEILGSDHPSRRPPYEGKMLTVVGFKPRYVNNVVVCDEDGNESLMPLGMVEKALSLK